MARKNFKIWVVTFPKQGSVLSDICFETDPKKIIIQARGGLEPQEIQSWFLNENDATEYAKELIGWFHQIPRMRNRDEDPGGDR